MRYQRYLTQSMQKSYLRTQCIMLSAFGACRIILFAILTSQLNKLHVVFDCADQYTGYSLIECRLHGPDLVNKLLFVLLHFRLHGYAIQADIRSMYNQVSIPS